MGFFLTFSFGNELKMITFVPKTEEREIKTAKYNV